MDQSLKNWVVSHYESMDSAQKAVFLGTLKRSPSSVYRIIVASLEEWVSACRQETGNASNSDYKSDPQEILDALLEHFAEGLAKIR